MKTDERWKSEPLLGWGEHEVGLLGLPLPEPEPGPLDHYLALLGVTESGGLRVAAQVLAAQGQGGDTLVAHLTPGNVGQCGFLRLTGPSGDGTLPAAATLTFPNNQNFVDVWNATGSAVTVMCAAGVGVTIPTGAGALLYCDGIDYKNAAQTIFAAGLTVEGQIHGVSTGTANTDAVNLAQMSAAIATAAFPATPGTVLNSVNDTAANYLSQKVDAQASTLISVTQSTENPAAAEKLKISISSVSYVASGTNAYAITPSPAIAAYAAGQAWLVVFANANTAVSPTLNISGLGARTIVGPGAATLGPGQIPAGCACLLLDDGTRLNAVGSKSGFSIQGTQSGGSCAAAAGQLCPIDCTGGNASVALTSGVNVGDQLTIVKFGAAGTLTLTGTVNGAASVLAVQFATEQTLIMTWTGATRGWV